MKKGFRKRRCFLNAQPLWRREALHERRSRILGVSSPGKQGAHSVTLFQAEGIVAGKIAVDDDARDFQTWNIRSAGRRLIIPLALKNIRPIDSGRLHLDQHFFRAWFRHRTLRRPECFRCTRLLDFHHSHCTLMMP